MLKPLKKPKPCAFKGCAKPVTARGLCEAHYQQLRRAKRDAAALSPLRKGGKVMQSVRLDEALTDQLRDLAKANGTSVYAECAAAVARGLSKA